MFSLLRQRFTLATLVQLAIELSWLFVVGMFAVYVQTGMARPMFYAATPAFVFALLLVLLNGAVGIYRRQEKLSSAAYVMRLCLAPLLGVPLAYLIAEVLPGGGLFQEHLFLSFVVAFGGLLLIRHALVLPLLGTVMPHRVLVLGTGAEARLIEASLASASPPGMRLLGFYALEEAQETAIAEHRIVAHDGSLADTARKLGVTEIIVAVRQQRGGVLPLRALLDCRLDGVQITDLACFFERVHGLVPIESLKVSWLIYGNGYRQDMMRSFVKRSFDLLASAALLLVALPIMALTALIILLESGAPVIYRQERIGGRGVPFTVLKFRSMMRDAEKDGQVWASVNDSRVTAFGRFIRRCRIDELPQLFNVLRGEMSFVGPRPERPEFVQMLTEQIPFYAVRHSVKPGITGWAQVRYSYGATVEQSVKKLEYDLYYVKNHTLILDLVILLETIRVVLLGEGAR